MTTNAISPAEIEALRAWIAIFPEARGPNSWQNRLMNAWLTGNYCGVGSKIYGHLQSIRNAPRMPNDLAERISILAAIAKEQA